METKAANREDVRIFTDDYGREWTITNIEKELWAWAFKLGESAESLAEAEKSDFDMCYSMLCNCDKCIFEEGDGEDVISDCICDDCIDDCMNVGDCDRCWSDDLKEGENVSNNC